MLRFLALVLLLAGPVQGAEPAAPALDPERVTVDFQDDHYRASLTMQVGVTPALALEVLTDFDHMADFVPNLASSHILARDGNVYRIAQQGKARFGPFSLSFASERRIELMPDGRVVAQALSGSTKYMRSELQVQAVAAGTRLDYRIDVVPDSWLPSGFGIRFMRHELAEQFSALGREMERRQKSRSLAR
jgi:carbon monoxide dehydrogenase subunit G